MAYCEIADLLLGDFRLSDVINKQKFTQDASEEMDIHLGTRWVTPVELDVALKPDQRTLKLILKQINAHLATGRILLAATISKEDSQTNAYGMQLIKSAWDALTSIVEGSYDYPGLVELESGGSAGDTAMIVRNQDSRSGVDAFYQVASPGGMYPLPVAGGWFMQRGPAGG